MEEPIDITELLTKELTFRGSAIHRLVIEFEHGKLAVNLPIQQAKPDSDDGLTPMQAAVLQAIDEMAPGEVLSHAEIAERAGYPASGPLRKFVSDTALTGKLKRTSLGWEKV